jgi:hypothetical protein
MLGEIDITSRRASMTRFFCGWKHYEPCAEGFCIRGECPEIPAEQSLAVEATENHGPEERFEIRCLKCRAVWVENSGECVSTD